MLAEDSSKETKREKYGDAVGQMAQGTANAIKNIANTLTEPSSKREIRVAKENLARRNTRLLHLTGMTIKICCNVIFRLMMILNHH